MSLNRHVSGQVLKSSTDRFWHQSFSDILSLSLCLHPVQQKLANVNVRLTFGHAQVGICLNILLCVDQFLFIFFVLNY